MATNHLSIHHYVLILLLISISCIIAYQNMMTIEHFKYCTKPSTYTTYTGQYGNALILQLGDRGSGGSFIHVNDTSIRFEEDLKTPFVFHLVQTNAHVIDRKPNMVYLGDTFQICTKANEKSYISLRNELFTISDTSPALFRLEQKYTDQKFCQANSIEYDIDINNRNTGCQFPYVDCFGRCGRRKLYVYIGTKWVTCGRDKNNTFSFKNLGGWETYEFIIGSFYES